MARDGFELLDVHDQAAVAVDEQDLAIAARYRNADGVREAGADGTEVANAGVQFRWPALRVGGGEIGAVSAAADQEPVLRHDTIDLLDGAARIDRAIWMLVGYRSLQLQSACSLLCPVARLPRPAQALVDRGDAKSRIGTQMKISHRAVVAHGARIGVDLDDASLRVKLAEMRREARQACANRNHEVCLGKQLRRH